MTTDNLLVKQDSDPMDEVKRLDAELQKIIDRLDEMNRKLEAENILLAKQLGLAPRPEVRNGQQI